MIGIPKPEPVARERARRRRQIAKRDVALSVEVCKRSGGRCEVEISGIRCARLATEIHHHKGKWRLRGRGDSALAEHKTHACIWCHRDITGTLGAGKSLRHLGGNRYERIF